MQVRILAGLDLVTEAVRRDFSHLYKVQKSPMFLYSKGIE